MKKTVKLLFSQADREVLRPLLEQLAAKGVRVLEEAEIGKKDTVLAVLSAHVYADTALTERLLSLVASGAGNVLPLQLDGAAIPDTLKNALYARNIIPAAGRDAAHTAERIISALPQKKSRLPLILGAAGIVLLAAVGLLIRQAGRAPEEAVPAIAQDEIVIPAALGLTEEDLAQISSVTIVGDLFLYGTTDREPVDFFTETYGTWEDGAHWYSKEDGHEYRMTRYDDLRFLALMPNLQHLCMALVEADAEALPDLNGLLRDGDVWISDCNIDRLDWLAGSLMTGLLYNRSAVTDFSPLTQCPQLNNVGLDLHGHAQADLSGFAPPSLERLSISNGQGLRSIDLSALSGVEKLRELEISFLPVSDLSFLEGAVNLQHLQIENMDALSDISAIGNLNRLNDLYFGYSPRITDYSPIAGCTALESIRVQGDFNPDGLRDASFLARLPKLRDIGLYSCNLNNMDFLEGVAEHQDSISLGFAGDIQDYSGLAAIGHFDYLHVNPRYNSGSRGGEFSAVLPYIRDAQIDTLMLYTCAGVDLSLLPDGIQDLSIRYGDLSDLTGLKPYSLRRLELWDCQYLTSLNGLENVPTLFEAQGQMELLITGCPRLTDYSALEGAYLETMKLMDAYYVPDLSMPLKINNLFLESIEGLSDLHCLDGLNGGEDCNLSLVGLDELYDLTPLRDFSGDHLTVPPQVEEQAQELVESGNYHDYEVAYPDGSWQPFDGAVELLSLEELETLPKSLLRRVERLCLVGDTLIDMEQGDVWEKWADGKDTPVLLFHNRSTDEVTPIEYGDGVVTDLSLFSELTGLRELRLYAQPLEDLNGIQNLAELNNLTVAYSPALTDASAAFACPQLQYCNLYGCPIESIHGVQNLQDLLELNLNNTKVTDISPLSQLDYSFAVTERDGFRLQIDGAPIEDYAPLAAIPVVDSLNINNIEAQRFIPYLEQVELYRLSACGAFTERSEADSNELFAAFIRSHPHLRELQIPWNRGITDLTPVLELENLEYLRVSFDMEEAIASLDGQSYDFALEIEGG